MADALVLRSLVATPVVVPMRRPLWTSVQAVTEAPLVLVDLHTEQGLTGHAYLFSYRKPVSAAIAALVADLDEQLRGRPVVPATLRRWFADYGRLVGLRGVVSMVGAALDMAAWDVVSQAAGLPLARMLGAEPRRLKAYNSNGLGLVAPAAAAEEALALLEGGFKGVKMRLGREDARQDLEAVRAVRAVLPEGVALMADYNQALAPEEALLRCRMLDGEGLEWIEEPIRHDDYLGYAKLKQALCTPLQYGENFNGPKAMAVALAAGGVGYLMPDAERIGGVSGWLEAAALGAAHEVQLSSHLFPEISAQLLSATPTAHWLEYVDWAEPLLATPLRVVDGYVTAPDTPGSGVAWNAEAKKRFAVA